MNVKCITFLKIYFYKYFNYFGVKTVLHLDFEKRKSITLEITDPFKFFTKKKSVI